MAAKNRWLEIECDIEYVCLMPTLPAPYFQNSIHEMDFHATFYYIL